MKKFEISGNTITSGDIWNLHEFQIVKKIPAGFFVWNIGENMGDSEWIPLCEDLRPGDKECFEIKTNTLKAIKLPTDEVQKLRDAAAVGVVDLKTAEKALKSRRHGYWSDRKREQAKKVIEIFRKIS